MHKQFKNQTQNKQQWHQNKEIELVGLSTRATNKLCFN